MKKTIDTLIEDIHSLFEDGQHEPNEENLQLLTSDIYKAIKESMQESGVLRDQTLRFSNIGKPDRALWYDLKGNPRQNAGFSATNYINFLFGHILEALLLFLAREAGHSVTHTQEEVEIDGVLGHTDGCIDGVVMDVKSASSYSFKKFQNGEIIRDVNKDPFGYVGQLSGYHEVLTKNDPSLDPNRAAWFVIDKQYGSLCLTTLDDMEMINTEKRVKKLKKVLEGDTAPEEKCYQPTPQNKTGSDNGNRVLHSNCGFCRHKHLCWADANNGEGLKGYQYSNGPVWFTHVEKEPKVPRVNKDGTYQDGFDIEE